MGIIQRFSVNKKKRILFCIVDNHDTFNSNWAREIAVNLSDFMIYKILEYDFDLYIGKDEDDLLREAYLQNFYTHAVIIACGTSFTLSDRIFESIENTCKLDFFIAGHILDRNDSYYELHHQFYIVNLAEYGDLNFPKIGKEEDVEHIQNIPVHLNGYIENDKKLPLQIKESFETKTYDKKLHGWNIISTALSKNKTLINIGKDIRDNKKYFYFEHDHVFLKEASELYYYQFFCSNFFAAWNSDDLYPDINFEGTIEQYVTVGIGFNWIYNLNLANFNKNTKVIFTDINYNCLMFMRSMIKDWDGINYGEFYKKHFSILPNNTDSARLDTYAQLANEKWKSFISNFEDWDTLWNKIKELQYDFINIDYTASYNLDWLDPSKKTFMNLSNLFSHGPYVATRSLKYRIACENRLINILKNKNPNIVLLLSSRAAKGFYPNMSRTVCAVSDYELTNINDLKKPNWHLTDWDSIKMLS